MDREATVSPNTDLDGPRYGPPPGAATALVVLLHGLGADGNDLIALAPYFARVLPGAAFVSPHAPFPCDMAPFGRQWFSLQRRDPDSILQGVRAAEPRLNGFLDGELTRFGLDDARLALVGFSQGAMMALHVAPRRERPCAAVIGYSGMLVAPDLLSTEARSRPPVLLVHGEADEIVDFSALPAARDGLSAAGFEVEAHARPGLGHGIDEEGIRLGMKMLAERLGAAATGT